MTSNNTIERRRVVALVGLLSALGCGGEAGRDPAAWMGPSGSSDSDAGDDADGQDVGATMGTDQDVDPNDSSDGAGPASGTNGPSGSDGLDGSEGPDDTEGTDGAPDTGAPPPAGIACDETFEWSGHGGCLSVVEGLDVKFFDLDEPAPVQRLVIYLHGDGGNEWFANWGFAPEILEWAKAQNFLVLGIKSPASYAGSDSPAFGAAQPNHADMVATTLESFLDAYEVVEDRQLYWGASGGSWFTTSSYIPVAGHRVPGVFVANCGGSGLSFGWQWDPQTDPATVALNTLFFNYGDQDFLADESAQSLAEYSALGFATGELVHPGATHCNHPITGPTLEFWSGAL